MKNARFRLAAVLLFGTVSIGTNPFPQEKPAQDVHITAVEIPVRVFRGTEFESDLTKEDFEIYDNGILQNITAFEAVSKTIGQRQGISSGTTQRPQGKRSFVLIFNVYDYTDRVGEAIDYFFEEVFNKESDRLIIVVEDKILEVATDDSAGAEIKDYLARYKRISRAEIRKAFHYLEERAQSLVSLLTDTGITDYPISDVRQAISQFIRQYQATWSDYRRRMLDVDIALFRAVINKIERMGGEKWAICFQQRDLFPRLKSQSRLDRELGEFLERDTIIRPQWQELIRSFDISGSIPREQISSLFAEANITFHLLILKSSSLSVAFNSGELDLQEVDSEYEDVLCRISRRTGGLAHFSNNVVDGLRAAAAKELRYYMLVYQPKDQTAAGDRKIDVKVNRKGVDVVSLKDYVRSPPPGVTISSFISKQKTVSFKIENCSRPSNKSQGQGRVAIRVSLFNEDSGKVFDQSKVLDLTDRTIRVTLDLNKLQSGYHIILIEAVDLISGRKDVFSKPIEF